MKTILNVTALLTATLSLASCGGGGPTVDTTAPTIALTATPNPVNTAGVISLTAAASDDVGVTKVTFYKGATEISSDLTAPYEAVSNVGVIDNGTVTYRAVATDAAGNTKEATTDVPVSIIFIPADFTPPSVVSTTPASAAIGVYKNVSISVVFSEKMNQAATVAAYSSASLPAASVDFSWNAGGTVLTINPKADLAYGVNGTNYSFSIGTGAKDLAGNALPQLNRTFRTFRQGSANIASSAALDGWIRNGGGGPTAVNTTDDIRVGDSGDANFFNATYTGYLSFDLGVLPPGAQVNTAELSAYQHTVFGVPYTDLKSGASQLMVDHVDYGSTLTTADVTPVALAPNFGELFSDPIIGLGKMNAFFAVKSDLESNRPRTQFRLKFPKATNNNNETDVAYIWAGDHASNKPVLSITYLFP